MKSIVDLLQNLRSDESGQDLIEYALIASLLGLATVATLTSLSTKIATVFTNLTNSMN